ncbi:DMT family transporter [Alisedimentitalea sp. MJ-SS2]|uniref:DMT family transporter n=1 Tax=Aliisedimentitalea sp. MJ-SS2 TaxID=3049795 RepID=UPI00290A311A|nr:DMT family transporter [Alisedimentitalea sp. MJ-SS2]MDU8925981.1 DMT family transporter [Alisedimentitalea sp. MJ-SS2]
MIANHRANQIGSLWMIASMGLFAIEDAFIKAAAKALPIGEILIVFGAGGTVAFAGLALIARQPLFVPDALSRPMRIRVVFEVIGRLFYVLALWLIPLSAATVILQATPLVVVAGAAVIFGEQVGWRRWAAILIGLTGVIIIIQPGADGFSVLSLLAVFGMLGFAGRDLASRAAPASLGAAVLGFYGFLAIIIAGLVCTLLQEEAFQRPDQNTSMALLGAVLAGVGAYACLMKAMRTGEVSAVTPFRYTRLLFGIALGIAVFDEQFTLPMLVGSGLIVLSGLFILQRSKQAAVL